MSKENNEDRWVLEGKSFVDTKRNVCLNFGIKDLARVTVQLNNMEEWLNDKDQQISQLKAENEKLKKLKILEGTNCTYERFIDGVLEDAEIANAKALEQINIDNEILRKQLAEKDNEIEKLKNYLVELDGIEEDYRRQEQQLAKKDAEIAELKELDKATSESLYASRELYEKEKTMRWALENQLKTNTHQVCEKIREIFSRTYQECNSQRQMWDKFFKGLDQIEAEEKQ